MMEPGRDPTSDHERSLELFRRLPEDRTAREEIIQLYAPLARYLATRFRGRGEALEDLVQVATVGLIKAVDRFDSSREVRFSTYGSATIVGESKRHFRDRAWALRVPRRLQDLGLQISRTTSVLHQALGRSPTVGELAGRIGVTEEEVLEAMDAMTAYTAESLDAPIDTDGSTSVDRLKGAEEAGFERLEEWESVIPAIRVLPGREKRILYLRFFQGRTQSQIADEIGISQMHVSRILTRTLEQIRETVEADER